MITARYIVSSSCSGVKCAHPLLSGWERSFRKCTQVYRILTQGHNHFSPANRRIFCFYVHSSTTHSWSNASNASFGSSVMTCGPRSNYEVFWSDTARNQIIKQRYSRSTKPSKSIEMLFAISFSLSNCMEFWTALSS